MATFMLIMLSSAMRTRICAAFSSPDSFGSGASADFLEPACFSCPPEATLHSILHLSGRADHCAGEGRHADYVADIPHRFQSQKINA